ncbi:hypothetical protein [Streptomyces sp. 2A115]|uniref:hypothetical protein n=1 Tax=Streptomyces sp. 2A115 TaxID=3457439 RepID=UPI003FD30C52
MASPRAATARTGFLAPDQVAGILELRFLELVMPRRRYGRKVKSSAATGLEYRVPSLVRRAITELVPRVYALTRRHS